MIVRDRPMTNYNDIADNYHQAEDHPIKTFVEGFTFLNRVGDIRDKSVLDLACGTGFYTRLLKQAGASRVVGVDLSVEMVAKAQAIEHQSPLGIEYRVHDVTTFHGPKPFNLITNVYLLPYAATIQQLTAMCQTMYDSLQVGGSVVALTMTPHLFEIDSDLHEAYGVTILKPEQPQNGAIVTFKVKSFQAEVEFQVYHWSLETYEQALQQAGFGDITWHPMQVSPAGVERFGVVYWQPLLNQHYGAMFECYKQP